MRHIERCRAILVTVCLLLSNGCKEPSSAAQPVAPTLDCVRDAAPLTLFEGLPSPNWGGQKEFEREMAEKQTIELDGYPFYRETLALQANDVGRLKAVLLSTDAVKPCPSNIRIMSQCGGFHPDYAIQWIHDGRTHEVLVCFTCEEVKYFGPHGQVDCEVTKAAIAELKTILKRYRKSRPAEHAGTAAT